MAAKVPLGTPRLPSVPPSPILQRHSSALCISPANLACLQKANYHIQPDFIS